MNLQTRKQLRLRFTAIRSDLEMAAQALRQAQTRLYMLHGARSDPLKLEISDLQQRLKLAQAKIRHEISVLSMGPTEESPDAPAA